jgi:prevent-host-death family protein
MTRKLTATETKAKILTLLDEVAQGEEIEITKHGHTVARLVGGTGSRVLKGRFSDVAMTTVDENELFTTGVSWNVT